jgi:hypothetical protein
MSRTRKRLSPWRAAIPACAAIGLWLVGAHGAMARDANAEAVAKAQAMVAATDLRCTVEEARVATPEETGGGGGRRGGGHGGGGMGGGSGASPEGGGATPRETRPPAYEVACHEGLGFILMSPRAPLKSPTGPGYMNCLEAKAGADRLVFPYECHLTENRDQTPGVRTLVTKVGLDCAVTAARGLGHTESNSFFEVACAKNADASSKGRSDTGYVLIAARSASVDAPVSAFSCFDTQANPALRCDLTKVGRTINDLHRFVAKSVPGCVPTQQRLAGFAKSGAEVFEQACRNGAAYLILRADNGALSPPAPCADAALAGKCRLAKAAPTS